jgi:hypothetical protein
LLWEDRRAFLGAALMMVLFFHAARLALVVFDPFLSSRALAEAIQAAPPGKLIIDHHYYTYSSIFFYLNRNALLLNAKFNSMEYGAGAPNAADVYLNDAQFRERWFTGDRYYLVGTRKAIDRVTPFVREKNINVMAASGGKLLVSNMP